MQDVTIYTDGAADPNPGYGGWGAILQYGGHEKTLSGNASHTTNNRMELQAAIAALEALSRPCRVQLYTDSEYVRRGITEWIDRWAAKRWRRSGNRPVPNADLWQKLWDLAGRHQIEWHWVRGHAGNPLNERVDDLAREARLAITPLQQDEPDLPLLVVRASCKGNPGPGGWGVVFERDGDTQQLSGSDPRTTNNRMELMGAIAGLDLLGEEEAVQIVTTSDYLFQGATRWIQGWRAKNWHKRDGKPIANADLWQALDRRMRRSRVRWINAKGEVEGYERALTEAARLAKKAVEIA
jgi:ribonuclease HI